MAVRRKYIFSLHPATPLQLFLLLIASCSVTRPHHMGIPILMPKFSPRLLTVSPFGHPSQGPEATYVLMTQ